jgi:hypothetical protein
MLVIFSIMLSVSFLQPVLGDAKVRQIFHTAKFIPAYSWFFKFVGQVVVKKNTTHPVRAECVV